MLLGRPSSSLACLIGVSSDFLHTELSCCVFLGPVVRQISKNHIFPRTLSAFFFRNSLF